MMQQMYLLSSRTSTSGFIRQHFSGTLKALPELKARQVVKIEFSPATLKLAKNVPFTFKRLLQRHLKNEELTGFTVFLRGKDSRGNNILYVNKTRQ